MFSLQIEAQCDATGSGAVNSAGCWQAQLTLCGDKECNPALLPPFGAAGSALYDPAHVHTSPFYCSSPAASKPAAKAPTPAQVREMQQVAVHWPPPPPYTLGTAQTIITSDQTSDLTGAIYPGPANKVQVQATCIIEGQYALKDVQNWPAQLQLCGPTGGQECSGISYDAAQPVLIPTKVTENKTSDTYTATYTFEIPDAWKGQPITHRYFLCMYKDEQEKVVQKSGASIDVPSPPRPPAPPPYNIFELLPIGTGSTKTRLGCTCGHITQLRVGFINIPARGTYASTVSFKCSDGQVVQDPAAALNPPPTVQVYNCPGGECTTLTGYFGQPVGSSVGIVGVENLGTATADSSTVACSAGSVFLGVDTARYILGTPLANAARLIRVGCGVPQSPASIPITSSTSQQVIIDGSNGTSDAASTFCRCGWVTGFLVGSVVTTGGKTAVATMGVRCSDGSTWQDPRYGEISTLTTVTVQNSAVLPPGWTRVLARFGKTAGLTTMDEVVGLGVRPANTQGLCQYGLKVMGVKVGRNGPRTMSPYTVRSLTVGCGVAVSCPPPPPAPKPPSPRPPPPVPKPPSPMPPPPSDLTGGVWGDPHFIGFDGSQFDWHGTPGQWADVIHSDAQAFGVSVRVEQGPYKGLTLVRAVAFKSGATVVGAELVQTGNSGAWVIQGKANRVLMEAGTPVALPGGITATVVQGNPGPVAPSMGTFTITGAFGQVTAAQLYRADKPLMTEYFNVQVRLSAPLALPVRGLLAPSYMAALARANARPQAAAVGGARNITFSAEVNAQDGTGCTALYMAVVAERLLEAGADRCLPSVGGGTPVIMASQRGLADCRAWWRRAVLLRWPSVGGA
ncbi:hypothetical protein C2E21_2859 [Chlorella sorokiniana]|uniref:Uncharacterized protein n=1 Tax=Chlorella sorokiniana TaxID=3076 RepID=A0A2P6TWN3_CHLSO|nr:hypothetical protein C2E21_2859 [Chlorella sorokiniana]|eukprot:PRW58476.1 hypothetical protein C2E21_2859 [Chlorella sorokiniana]